MEATEKDKIAETAETEDKIKTVKTVTCTETVRVHREPRDCNMYRDLESQETVTCTETVRVHHATQHRHFTYIAHQSASHHGSTKVNCQRQVG